jgi:hypothetical protein
LHSAILAGLDILVLRQNFEIFTSRKALKEHGVSAPNEIWGQMIGLEHESLRDNLY